MYYDPIQLMTAQQDARTLYPFREDTDLHKHLLERQFYDMAELRQLVSTRAQLPLEDRDAVQVARHGTDTEWVQFLVWLNDTYGKDGSDILWMPGLEEYYEYNYYRQHSNIEPSVQGNQLEVKLSLPTYMYFYYPSVTIHIKGIEESQIASLLTNDEITGLSYASCEEGVMVNIDCRKYLLQHAIHFVEKYENDRTDMHQKDAQYFVSMLKDSAAKEALQSRIK